MTTYLDEDASICWLNESRRFQLTQRVRFGRSGTHRLRVEVTVSDLLAAAALLRDHVGLASTHEQWGAMVLRGRRAQVVQVRLPRKTLLAIADAIADVADDLDEAGHRFWHYDHPDVVRPCSSCRETLDAEDAFAEKARVDLIGRWADALDVPKTTIETMLAQYAALPRKARRP